MTSGAIAVNLLWCRPGLVGGSEEYLVRQLLGLASSPARASLPSVELFVPEGFADSHPDLAEQYDVRTGPASSRARRLATEIGWLRRRTHRAALIHHGGGTAPPRGRRPYVVTVHDLQYLALPQHFSRARRSYLAARLPPTVARAEVVAVPSEYVRGSVIRAFHVDDARVVVVPHGIEPAVTTAVTPERVLRRRYALGDGPVITYPAMTHPHKRHAFLLDVMSRHWTDPDLRLVLIGGTGAAEGDVTRSRDRRVCRLGRVSASDRNGLIAMSASLVFPSEYEGFGAPVIEAMALGTPVVASNATCLPEVIADAGLVLPLDEAAWAGALTEVDRRREELVAGGSRRAELFTAARSGSALAVVYAKAMERP